MTSLRLSLRSKLLAWLGYDFKSSRPSENLDTAMLLFDLSRVANRLLRCDTERELGVRRVPEVPPGVVRIVVEVSE
jgi:hypothetical protein